MRITRVRLFAAAVLPVVVSVAASFSAAAVLAEGALHALLRRRPNDTAALAQSIAQAGNGKASQVNLRAMDGVPLHAWWLSPEHPAGRTVIVCHGVSDSAYGVLAFALLFLTHGYSVLAPDSRGHGQSGGFVTYGVLEADDMSQWLVWTTRTEEVSRLGSANRWAVRPCLNPCSAAQSSEGLLLSVRMLPLSKLPTRRVGRVVWPAATGILVKEALLYTRLRYGVNLADARPDLAVRGAKAPVLLIHGLNDRETLPIHSEEIASGNPGQVKLWLVPGAAHTGA